MRLSTKRATTTRNFNAIRRAVRRKGAEDEQKCRHAELESLDVSLRPQTGEPLFLKLLSFFVDQFLLDVRPRGGEGFHFAAVFIFHFENVVVAAELDDVADLTRLDFESRFLERAGESFAINPAPIAA